MSETTAIGRPGTPAEVVAKMYQMFDDGAKVADVATACGVSIWIVYRERKGWQAIQNQRAATQQGDGSTTNTTPERDAQPLSACSISPPGTGAEGIGETKELKHAS